MRCTVNDLDWLARLLAGLPFAFQVRTPPALCDALDRIRNRLAHATGRQPPLNRPTARS
jgi:hypothetical protein